ncbi:MAG: hypothetical protein LBM09_01090, partial [Candidatus Nomurabacteria bacterium]|nr:hypothetical protein [Candidatus Nomurabacteria bacterium]
MSNNPNSASPTSKNSEITPEDFEKLVDGADEEVSQQMGAATLNLATGEKPKILAYQYDKVLETMKALVDDFSKTSFFGKEKNLTKTVAELKGIISKTVNDILSSAVHEDDKITDDEIEVILQKLEEDGFIGANKGKYTFAGKDDFYQLYKSYKIDQSNTKRSPAPASVADSVKIAMSNDPEITAKVIASMLSGVGNNNGNGEQNQQDSQNPSELPQDPSVTQWIIPPTPPSSNNVVPPATVLPPAPNSDNHTENGGDQLNEAEKSQLKDAIGKAAVSFLRNIFEGKSTSVSEIKIGNLTVSEAKAKLGDEWDNDTEFFKKAGLLELSNEAIEKLKNFFKDIHFSDEENAKLDASEGLIDKENYTNNADSLIHDLTTGDGYARIIGPNGKKLRMRIVATKNGETNVNVPENLGEFQGRLGEVNKDNPQRFAANKMSNFIKYGALISRNNSESMDYLGNFRKELDGRLSTEKIEAGETQFRIYENDTPTGDTWNYFAANKIIPEAGNLEARAAASETDEGYA